ncbi:MAG TPA: LOG family protein [Acidimicrobiia bacterium]|nr:LOG family protein [Acidimicrobiia bacterium]
MPTQHPTDHPPLGDAAGASVIAVFGSSAGRPGEAAYEAARECGRLLAEAGYAVATGGYGGAMEACSRGAADAGGRVIGVTAPAAFPGRPGANHWVQVEIPAPTLTERIHLLLNGSAACIALDGSIGTLTELLMAWNLAFVAGLSGAPARSVVAVGPTWAAVVAYLVAAIRCDPAGVTLAPDAAAAVAEVRRRVPPAPSPLGPGTGS